MDRKYIFIFILIWLIVSVIIALFFFLPFIFFAIAVLLILLAYDFYQKGRPLADKPIPKKARPSPVISSAPVPDIRTRQAKERKATPVPEGISPAAIDLKNKGNAFFRQNKFEDAIRCYASAVDIDPGYIDAWNNLGLAFLKAGKVDLAKSCNEKVKELTSTRHPGPAQEPVAHTPVVPVSPAPEEPHLVPEEKTGLQKEEEKEIEPDTISFLRNVARPEGYIKKEPEQEGSPKPTHEITRGFTEIPIITAENEPDWKNLFKSVSEMDAPGKPDSSTLIKDLNLKGAQDDIPVFDRVIPPLEKEEVQGTHPAPDINNEPEITLRVLQDEKEPTVPEQEDIIPGTIPEEITITREEPELQVPGHEDIIPGTIPEEITITREEPELQVPGHEDIIPGTIPEEITITREEPELQVPEQEVSITVPVPEEIPVHISVQATDETPSPISEDEVQFAYDIDAEIPGYTLLPPEIEDFQEEMDEILTPGPDNIPVISEEEKLRAVKEEIVGHIKGGIQAPGIDERRTEEEILTPRHGLPGPGPVEKSSTDEPMKQELIPEHDSTLPGRKSESPSAIMAETAIRKPKAERFPQEIGGGFEPYEQMVAHESLLKSEKAGREEVKGTANVPEKQILIVDDNDYIVTGLEHMLRKNGYLTASCNTGQEALEILRNKHIDAALLDLNMEPMNGWQLLGIMRSDIRTKDIPVIIFSAKETLAEEASRTPLKISAFLSKPVNTRLLLSELKKIFETEESGGQ
jgi:CheY-like chemotaxis protein